MSSVGATQFKLSYYKDVVPPGLQLYISQNYIDFNELVI